MSWIDELIHRSNAVIVVGAGGVGKTTSSIALAMRAAKLGKRVGLISIDPAKRLAKAMGIQLSGELSRIQLPAALKINGELSAAMLDQQGVFDAMVDRFAPSPSAAASIKAHSFYKAASQNLAGALEFMALAKLQEMVESSKFDLVIVDTPPDAHALDFLARPDSIARFVDSKVTTWMLKPFAMSKKLGFGSLFSKGEKLMGGIAKVAGLSALQTMAEFLILIQDVMVGFHRAGTKVTNTIKSPSCAFIMVTAPKQAPIRAAMSMMEQLKAMHLSLDGVLVNRCLAKSIAAELNAKAADAGRCRPLLNLRNRSTTESQETEQVVEEAKKLFPNSRYLQIEEQSGTMDNLEAITQLASALG